METVREFPPNYSEIQAYLVPEPHACFTYGEKIYAPDLEPTQDLQEHVIVHERVHMNQQGDDPATWWTGYLKDKDFRLTQEVEAYAAQYAYILSTKNPAKQKVAALDYMSRALSSPQYALGISQGEAASKIRLAAKAL